MPKRKKSDLNPKPSVKRIKKTDKELKVVAFLHEIEVPFRHTYDKITPVEEAAEIERAQSAVTELMEDGFNLNTPVSVKSHKKCSVSGETLTGSVLHLAAHYLRKYFLQELLDKGANINKTDAEGLTALQVVLTHPYKKWTFHCVRLLIERGAKLDVVDNEGRTLLDIYNMCSIKEDKEIVTLLIERGVKRSSTSGPLSTALAKNSVKIDEYLSLMEQLTTEQLNQVDHSNRTFLHYLAFYGKAVTPYLRKEVNIDVIDSHGRTPLHYALLTGNIKNIKALYKLSKWDSEKKLAHLDNYGNNILHFLFIGIMLHTFNGAKLCHFPELRKRFTTYLSIFKNDNIVKLLLNENASGQTPIEYSLSFIKSNLPNDFDFVEKNHLLLLFKKRQHGIDFSIRGLDHYYYNHFFLNLHLLLPEKTHDEVEAAMLARYCHKNDIIKQFILPTYALTLLAKDYGFQNEYLANKIQKLPPFLLNPFISNAALFQTYVIKTMCRNSKNIRSGINYGPQIVFNLFKGVLPNGTNLIKDSAFLIASFLDRYTLNIVLPQVRKECGELSRRVMHGDNTLTIKDESKEISLTGQDANNFLWDQFCRSFFPIWNVQNDKKVEEELYKKAIIEKITFYWECRGMNPDYSYPYIQNYCKEKTKFELDSLLNFGASESKSESLYKGLILLLNYLKKLELNTQQSNLLPEESQEQKFFSEMNMPEEDAPILLGDKEYPSLDTTLQQEPQREESGSLSQLITQNWVNSPIFRSTPPSSPSYSTYESEEDTNSVFPPSPKNQ